MPEIQSTGLGAGQELRADVETAERERNPCAQPRGAGEAHWPEHGHRDVGQELTSRRRNDQARRGEANHEEGARALRRACRIQHPVAADDTGRGNELLEQARDQIGSTRTAIGCDSPAGGQEHHADRSPELAPVIRLVRADVEMSIEMPKASMVTLRSTILSHDKSLPAEMLPIMNTE